jgi:hypothetical protein
LRNSIRVLKDAQENYPAWLDAIAGATRSIHFESYIIHDDEVGATFSDGGKGNDCLARDGTARSRRFIDAADGLESVALTVACNGTLGSGDSCVSGPEVTVQPAPAPKSKQLSP